jgi:hypothetical protein
VSIARMSGSSAAATMRSGWQSRAQVSETGPYPVSATTCRSALPASALRTEATLLLF